MYDVVIIGSGPAGLSAAIYAQRAGLKALTLEKNPMSGGQVLNTYEVDNYPGLPGINGFDMAEKFRAHADKLGCGFKEATVLGIMKLPDEKENAQLLAASSDCREARQRGFVLETDQGEIRAKTILAATGATHAKLNVPGEEELTGMGVSYCATCDGAFFRGKVAAVVGGGDVAVEDAIFLARGCQKVYLIHRRDELRAAAVLQKEVMALPNVEILWDTVAERINGGGQVESLSIRNVKTGRERELPVQGVFVAVGIIPSAGVFGQLAQCNEKGYLIAGEDCATTCPGLYAAGDVRGKKLRQVVTAVADGANAITSILDYLAKESDVF